MSNNLNEQLKSVGLAINAPLLPAYLEILTPDALKFIAALCEQFEARRRELLSLRVKRKKEISQGVFPDFLSETKNIRESEWKVAPIPSDLQDRRVEITGPVSRKMIINALNSGAKVFMADFEDANAPTWANNIEGQFNLRDAVNGTISFSDPNGKQYKLVAKPAVLMVRPRGWHLREWHVTWHGEPISASLFDFALYFFHNAKTLLSRGSGPYFYLPKMESHKEARLWRDVFAFSEKYNGVPQGSIRATVLIETIMAAFEMDEILYELREYSAGLNCGRWDYIFSYIKKFIDFPEFVVPDRAQVDMLQHFMHSYVQLLIKTCHRRGIHAMGGMAAQIPIRDSKEANEKAMDKVSKDKLREVKAGHDGTWVAHPGLIPIAMDIFNKHMPAANQLHVIPQVSITQKDLLQVPTGTRTVEALRTNIKTTILYLEAWLTGNGCVPINNLMEDLATAEIGRVQIQQQLKHKVVFSDGTPITQSLVLEILDQEVNQIKSSLNRDKSLLLAKELFTQMIQSDDLADFMSIVAYPYIITPAPAKL